MKYTVEITKKALKSLQKIDKTHAQKILLWLEKNINGCKNPRAYGKALTGDFSECWRYRIGNYRLIAKIVDNIVTVIIIDIGHRKDIYQD